MKLKIYFLSILSMLTLSVSASDYVDDINNATVKNEAGHRVIYEMNIGMFTQAGTFAAAQQQLGELKTLGVDIIWLMPIYPRGNSNSPYAVIDFESTNTKYGSVNDLKSLVAAAHEKGMSVILDWVPNQTANEHPWRSTHPSWYTGTHTYADISDLNYDNAEMKAEMMRIMKSWIDRCDIDGFRFDFVVNTKPSYWITANKELKDYAATKGKSYLILLAEIDTNDNPRFSNKTNNIGFTHDYAWWLQETVLRNGFAKNSNIAILNQNLQKFVADSKTLGLTRMVYLTNHDQNFNDGGATLTDMYGANRYALTVLQFTLYGMPLIYNGMETGGNQVLNYFNDTKINWNTSDATMKHTLRTLCAMKHAVPALADDADVSLATVSAGSTILAFTRKASSTQGISEVLVVLNLGTTATSAVVSELNAGEWTQWLSSQTIAQGVSQINATLTANQNISLEAGGYRVYVRGSSDPTSPDVYIPLLRSADEMSLFFETATQANYQIWAWGGGITEQQHLGITGEWDSRPAMTLMGQAANGHYIYKFTFCGSVAPTNFIITKNGDNPRPYDGAIYVVNGYYVEGNDTPTQIITATGIQELRGERPEARGDYYDLSGRKVSDTTPAKKGIYIRGGKKYVVK